MEGFSDPLIDCKDCKVRYRADKLIEDWNAENGIDIPVDGWGNEQLVDYIKDKGVKCPGCGSSNFTDVRKFNLMFKTFQGVTEDSQSEIYLRPETAQVYSSTSRMSRDLPERRSPSVQPDRQILQE